MSDQAIEYVRSLDRRQITWKQKSILKVIAEYHKCHQKGAHFSFKTLMDETFTDRSNLQKQLARLEDLNLIEYTPGCGQGNYSHFRFLALDFERQPKGGLKAVERAVERAVVFGPLIRKEDQNQKQSQNLKTLDSKMQSIRRPLLSVSSSTKPESDDDIEVHPSDLQRVIAAFENSPVVSKRRAGKADFALARRFLDPTADKLTAQQIENGILLGTARKIASDRQNGTSTCVQSLAYFENCILEAATDTNLTDSYMQHVRQIIGRYGKRPMGVAAS
jgi:hypothetical protein